LERLLGGSIELVLSLDDAAGQALVDRTQLERVVLNLVANARDAMPLGGRLTLRTHMMLAEHARAAGDSLRDTRGAGTRTEPRAYVVLTVIDEGVGMDRSEERRVGK